MPAGNSHVTGRSVVLFSRRGSASLGPFSPVQPWPDPLVCPLSLSDPSKTGSLVPPVPFSGPTLQVPRPQLSRGFFPPHVPRSYTHPALPSSGSWTKAANPHPAHRPWVPGTFLPAPSRSSLLPSPQPSEQALCGVLTTSLTPVSSLLTHSSTPCHLLPPALQKKYHKVTGGLTLTNHTDEPSTS